MARSKEEKTTKNVAQSTKEKNTTKKVEAKKSKKTQDKVEVNEKKSSRMVKEEPKKDAYAEFGNSIKAEQLDDLPF